MASALENISKAAELAGQRLQQLEHEKVVLEQKKEVNVFLRITVFSCMQLAILSGFPFCIET